MTSLAEALPSTLDNVSRNSTEWLNHSTISSSVPLIQPDKSEYATIEIEDTKPADLPHIWTVKPCLAGNIGLQNAVHAIEPQLKQRMWIGTLGKQIDSLDASTRKRIQQQLLVEHDCLAVMPSDNIMDGHYNKYCKQVIWPLFHYVMLDDSRNIFYQTSPWEAYRALNEAFADAIVSQYQDGDIIWVNDYHLMLLPGMLRSRLPNAVIGFFLHIPFPSSELFRTLPQRKELLEAMIESDLIGFQTYSFARHFLQTCSRILSLETTPLGIQMDSHYVAVRIFPIGIDMEALKRKMTDPDVARWTSLLKEKYAGKKLIVARDKLDYIKGVRQKLLAFEQFLAQHPEWQGKVVLIQITLSTSEQNEMRVHISDVVSRVNAKYSNISYQPIVILHQDIAFSQYLALLSSADVSLITPLRDGMNLTSHEYIVCQEKRHNPLILSEFTGTYGSFGACLRVNPWDYREVGNAIHEALTMSDEEKQARWKGLYKSIQANSAQAFASSIITELTKVQGVGARRVLSHIPPLNLSAVKDVFHTSHKRLFLFDYGGTLLPHNKSVGSSEFSRLADILTRLTSDTQNIVYVISGRTKASIERDLGDIPNLGLSAENGFYIKPRGESWQQLFDNIDLSWKPTVNEIFQYYTERTPGAYIETKETSVVWHYRTTRESEAQFVAWQAAECQNHIADSVNKNFTVHALVGHRNIEVIPHEISKSAIATRILQDIQPDFVLSIGDDRSDEDMFTYLNKQPIPHVFTCTVGLRSTEAKYHLIHVERVLDTLETLLSSSSSPL